MAYYVFAWAIVVGLLITLYQGGTLRRDSNYVNDISVASCAAGTRRAGAGVYHCNHRARA